MTAVVIAAVLLVCIAFLYGIFLFAFCNLRKHPEKPRDIPNGEQYRKQREWMERMIEDMLAVPCERVTTRSHDGLVLSARYYHAADGAPVEIEFHGYRGSAIRDFCGGNPLSREAGRNMLLVDQRGNGESGGRVITFGIKERQDVLTWVEYVRSRFGKDVPILLSGISMGASSVIMAAGMNLPGNVRGVVADCPFSSPEAIIKKVGRQMHLPMNLLYPAVRLSARLFGGFDPNAASAVEAARDSKIPILLIHGEDDRFVPCDMSREIHAACPVSELHTTPEAGHGLSFIVDRDGYANAVARFCKRLGL